MKEIEQIEIGRYHIQSHLARGGMADIYLAYDAESGQTVAVKMVHESAGEYYLRFRHEVEEMAGLAHEHILPAFDYGEYRSWYFLVTPYIEYGTLNGRLASGPLSLEEVDIILAQLAEALQFAHEQGIIHRDVKPSNILMRDGDHVYLADFGLVKRVGEESGLTVTGYLIGTPEYMAPELAEGEATPLSDVYALGVLLYQMLAGRVPFKANTPMGVFLRHIRDLPEPPTTFNSSIPAEVEVVVLRALEKDPERRYQSARELYEAYQQAVRDAAARKEALADHPTQVTNDQLVVIPEGAVQPGNRRRKRLLLAAALAAVLLMGIFVFASPSLPPHGRGRNSHTADAQDASDRHSLPSPNAAGHTTPGALLDSAASKRSTVGPTTETVDANATHAASTVILNQSPTPTSIQQDNNTTNNTSTNEDNNGSNDAGSSKKSGSGSPPSTGSADNSGSGQSTGNSGAGQTSGDGGSGNSGGAAGGSSAGSGNDQGVGKGKGAGKDKGSGDENGNGKENDQGNGKGNGQGNGGGKGHGKGND